MSAKGSATGRAGSGRTPGPPTRRRGSQLETALLDAAWAELTAFGYHAFTMEGVANRANTGRAVLYRRWSNRPDLAMAAIRHHSATTMHDLPNTGTLRGDVLALLRQLSASVSEMTGVLSFMFADYFDATGLSPSDLRERLLVGTPSRMAAVIQRAVERGEIDPDRLTPRIASLPVDLVRHDLIMKRAPVPDKALVEIVDRIFLPLIGIEQPTRATKRSRNLP